MTEKEISDALIEDLAERQYPIYLTHFSGRGFFEADVFAINKTGYMTEYEIKISRGDFFADLKHKDYKHRNLRDINAVSVYDEWKNGNKTGGTVEHINIPNRFYYACPVGLIKKEEVPEYAGLVYVDGEKIIEIKPANLLHKTKADARTYARVATMLSERLVWGEAYRTFKFKEKQVFNKVKELLKT